MKRTLVFDFDGTLVDSLEVAIEFGILNQARFSKHSISRNDFRNYSMREALKRLGLPWYKLPRFVRELKEYMRTNSVRISVFPEVAEMVAELHRIGWELFILSSNARDNIETILRRSRIETHFREIVSDSSIFGKHRAIKRLIRDFSIQRNELIYIGDEVRDAEACKESGVDFLAVSWGWDSLERLKQVNGIKIAETPQDLRAILTVLPRTCL
jgi:phosphoglycolate phosphatase